MMWLLVKYVLTAALRDRLLLGFILLMMLGVSLSVFMGSSALTEKDQFSLVFAAGGLRIAGLITLTLFIVFYMRRSFETRDVEYMLSRPISRFQFLMAHSFAFGFLASLAALLITTLLFFMPSTTQSGGVIIWGLSLWVEYIIMVNVALFFAFSLSSAVVATMMTFALYMLARLMGSILGIIAATGESAAQIILEKIMLVISIFVPRLDLMGQTSWLLYGFEDGIGWSFILLQGSIFCGLIFSATLIDLNRRQF